MKSIIEISKEMNITSRTLRFYEEKNLIKSVRSESNIRYYCDDTVEKIKLILLFRELNFSIDDISSFVSNINNDNIKQILFNKQNEILEKVNKLGVEYKVIKKVLSQLGEKYDNEDVEKFLIDDIFPIYKSNSIKTVLAEEETKIKIIDSCVNLIIENKYKLLCEYVVNEINLDIIESSFDGLFDKYGNENLRYKIFYTSNLSERLVLTKIWNENYALIVRFVFSNLKIVGIWVDNIINY